MRAFEVKKGTRVNVMKEGQVWALENVKTYVTQKDNLFFIEEMVLDPMGMVAPKENDCFGEGFYGFLQNGWYCVIQEGLVNVY